jgi:hypothetical protein
MRQLTTSDCDELFFKLNNECEDYLDGFCIKDIDSARIWDCTCKNKKERIKQGHKRKTNFLYNCPYPKLRKDK